MATTYRADYIPHCIPDPNPKPIEEVKVEEPKPKTKIYKIFGERQDCLNEYPYRYLDSVITAYPDVVDVIRRLPKTELCRRIDRQVLLTNYNLDYNKHKEYPLGIYETMKNAIATGARTLPCRKRKHILVQLEDLRNEMNTTCAKAYRRAECFGCYRGQDSEHRKLKDGRISEYAASISRTGCVIKKNKLHDHKKCYRSTCIHELRYPCAKYV
ncbi:uncharacterized protein LOC119669302 [Teleopsis dalmanni]|uniref:uncharacterized protein LOC119667764 n=1 Tax=Teleopsis dalmanni TaxID=139649 RepID=UPI0018CDCC42|nr:uncharacterized protein LOC119667764 [Teleopsis dalmanni]XP_037935073.1 uncharacterized protein LOC119669302 [Teleopsis dalmanni]